MKRAKWLQETRMRRFEEAFGGWTEKRLTQEEAAVPVADEKDVRERVDAAKAAQAARPAWKPAPDHPWRRPFKPSEREAA